MTSNATCATGSPATSNIVNMTVTPTVGTPATPTPSATTICQGSANTAYTTSATNATSYTWTVTGTSNTISGTGTTGTVTWAAGFSGAATVRVTANGCNGPSTSASTTVTVRPTPVATFSYTATPYCRNATNPYPTFGLGGVAGIFSSTAGLNFVSTATGQVNLATSTAGTYTVTNTILAAGGCADVIATAPLTITPIVGTPVTPTPSATTICQGSGNTTYTTTAANATGYNWTVTGTGNTISGTGTTATVTWAAGFSGAATVSVTAIGCNGLSSSASTTVTVRPTPTATISGTITVCQNATAPVITFNNPQTLPVTITYNINGANQTMINVGAGTSATVNALTNTTGIFAYNLVSVIYQTAPACSNILTGTATVTVNQMLMYISVTTPAACSPDLSTYSLAVVAGTFFGTLAVVTATSGIVANTGGNGWNITGVLSGTNVTVKVTDGSGCESTIVVTAPNCACPVVQAPVSGGNKSYCASGVISAITATVSSGETIDWYSAASGGTLLKSGSLSYIPQAAGTYYAIARNTTTGCLSSTRTPVILTMDVIPLPTLSGSDADNTFCPGTSITFTAGGGTDYNFRVGGISVQATALATYTTSSLTNGQIVDVIVTGSNGCTAISTGITNIVNAIPAPNAGTGGFECDLNFSFNALPSLGVGTWTKATGPGTVTFNPAADTPTAEVTVSEYGTYNFTWTEVNEGCSNSATVTVIFSQQPVANPGAGGNNCGLEFLLNATPGVGVGTWTKTEGTGPVDFSPNANTPNSKVTVSDYGNYTFTWTEVNGTCSNSASANVNFVKVPAANAGKDSTECDLDFVLNAIPGTVGGTGTWSMFSGPGDAIFSPDPDTSAATVTVTKFGEYEFVWTEVNSTCQSADLIKVIFYDLPSVSAGRDTVICIGESVQLEAMGVGSFQWKPDTLVNNPEIIDPIATPLTSTLFNITLTDQHGCKNSDTILVEVRKNPVAYAGPDQILENLFRTTMAAAMPDIYESGKWSLISGNGEFSDSLNPKTIVSALSLGENILLWTVTNGFCPSSSDSLTILIHDFVIPTLITPNMDGKNDYFVLKGIETLGKTELTIFDRRGAQVYSNNNYDNKWNGVDYHENPLPDDTYFFVLKTVSGKSISGYIVIKR